MHQELKAEMRSIIVLAWWALRLRKVQVLTSQDIMRTAVCTECYDDAQPDHFFLFLPGTFLNGSIFIGGQPVQWADTGCYSVFNTYWSKFSPAVMSHAYQVRTHYALNITPNTTHI